ncbi:molybdopterin-synthase adenylyltransferase MoeB [Silicimonas algicola]|uniref:Molybdopterin-synthase adenylyltransferase n=1 Tax=Silicimonas algicola TaxID=1826607 RepID=A0A316GC27_9RHOB|nr:molybdopterin-synthase adenylyltransferase MoeB [Silicimonas algicola]AZQ66217.1 molybdopterin-synthase adenylyltransferase MoeB [Silicimonas algicola]PWK58529.1 molybdopterin/thiamine biosynthesis adenylyltransferase [Silicimonas algicola]
MALVLALAAALWVLGAFLKVPRARRIYLMIALYVAVLGIHLLLPDEHPVRMATGRSADVWLIIGAVAAAAGLYAVWIRRLRDRARPAHSDAVSPPRDTSSSELERNARHIVLREIGGPGQKRLKEARVLVIGAGGLGAPALQYLAAAGVGTIGVIDHDTVDNSNLQRQVIHIDARVGMPKVFSAREAMLAQNPHIAVRPYHRRLTGDIAAELVDDYDIILDGTDDVATRYLVNEVAVAQGKPLVSAAISQWEGQISVFDPARDAPCYACVFPEPAARGLAPSCAEGGVLGPLPGVLGAMMAVETVKLIARTGEPLRGRLMIYDALYAEVRTIGVKKRSDCRVCGSRN